MAYKEEDFLQFSGLQHFRFCRWQWALIHVENQLAENGNVLLRRMQYRAADEPVQSCQIARLMIFGKLYNARWSIERTRRDHGPWIDEEIFRTASETIRRLLSQTVRTPSLESLSGVEGIGAAAYFGVFDDMLLWEKTSFY